MSRSRDLANLADEATGGLVKADIGLGNVDNTADSAKPVSTAQQTEIDKLAYQGEPHIITRYLHPAIEGKSNTGVDLKALVTAGSYAWGDVYSGDNLRYFYTDIKGSRKIHDPRVGSHFGSQRHKFKSLQLLEQETATHGSNVYSVDGREWIRAVGDIEIQNAGQGLIFNINDTTTFFEITGYFNQFNWLEYLSESGNARNRWILAVDGTATTTESANQVSVDSPLGGRYVDAVSVRNINTGLTTPRIVTIKMTTNSVADNAWASGCELIAHDTSNVNEIKIPKQNVVSYGKKFEVGSDTMSDAVHPHYNPFNNQTIGDNTGHGKNTSGWTTYDSTLHEASSLGLDAWKDGSNYYRPVNGGRIVKWVDENGNIKTSVNMLPPSAKAIGSHSGDSGPHETPWTSAYQPVFSSGDPDHSQTEVATSLYAREFGNGSANGNADYADISTVIGDDDVAFVMDDGLTSMSGSLAYDTYQSVKPHSTNSKHYLTFIGTGLTLRQEGNTHTGIHTIAQNLPFGAHVFSGVRNSTASNTPYSLDGVQLFTGFLDIAEVKIHQPKRPPIPEDSVILADYMLLADFVPQTDAGATYISKGTRRQNVSRDVFVNHLDGTTLDLNHTAGGNPTSFGYYLNQSGTASSETRFKVRIPSFGTNYVLRSFQSDSRSRLFIDDTDKDSVSTKDNTATYDSYAHLTNNLDLGVYNFGANAESGTNLTMSGFDIATPIHTSSHYQPFETPFLHELIGGDRNMEQTNLICTPDGRSWDEVTRDTSYIGNLVLQTVSDTAVASHTDVVINDEWRGYNNNNSDRNCLNKDFAIAHDRVICLVDGVYHITRGSFGSHQQSINLNGQIVVDNDNGSSTSSHTSITLSLKRGDYIQVAGQNHTNINKNYFFITKD